MPPGFHRLIAAQFLSALADNALLIVTIALLDERGLPAWWAPLLKFGFTLSYVLLAPFVGPLADAMPKARLMAWMNGVKVLGVLALLAHTHPVLAYTLVGIGAAAYAPAKYGLITELVPAQRLVAANGWIEVSVVCAALLGTGLGGALVSPLLLGLPAIQALVAALPSWPPGAPAGAGSAYTGSLLLLLGVYAAAGLLNRGVPDSGARYPASGLHPGRLLQVFWQSHRTLWADRDGGLSLAVTTIFWGVGATLQFAVLRWAAQVLHLPLDRGAWLQAAVALGVIAGAAAAGRWVPLERARQMLVVGVLLGALMPVVVLCERLGLALAMLMTVGAVSGLLVVPLNALLQHRGCQLLSAGRSIAVQGASENASVLAMLGTYALLLWLEVPIVPLMQGFGALIALAMLGLMWRSRRAVAAPGTGRPTAHAGSAHAGPGPRTGA